MHISFCKKNSCTSFLYFFYQFLLFKLFCFFGIVLFFAKIFKEKFFVGVKNEKIFIVLEEVWGGFVVGGEWFWLLVKIY